MHYLYECSECGSSVKVVPQGEGNEPLKQFSCGHDDAIIWANRKVTLRGTGDMSITEKASIKFKLTVRQLLSTLTGRSI